MRLFLNNKALFEGEVNKFFKQYEDKQTKYALQVGMGPFVHPSYITDKHKPFLSDVIISELYLINRDGEEVKSTSFISKEMHEMKDPEYQYYELLSESENSKISDYQIFDMGLSIENIKDPYDAAISKLAFFDFRLRFEYNKNNGMLNSYICDLKPRFVYSDRCSQESRKEHYDKFMSDIKNIIFAYEQLMNVFDSVDIKFKINIV